MNKQSLTQLALSGMMMGGLVLTGCEKSTTAPVKATSNITSAKTVDEFKAECAKLPGAFSANCKGLGTCAGYSMDANNVVTKHTCSGLSSCSTGNCKEG
jgi:hypothetical protein